jgi:hypothetical protein
MSATGTNPTSSVDPREVLGNYGIGINIGASLMNICGVSHPFLDLSRIN